MNPQVEFKPDGDDFIASIVHQLYTHIVKEEDEYTMGIIEDYVKKQRDQGVCMATNIIPEGKLRHIINLGLTRYAAQEHIDLKPADMFPQEQYIEYLRRELMLSQQTIYNLQQQVEILQKISGIISTDTNID